MIEVDLGDLKKSGKEISRLLQDKLGTDVSLKGSKLIVSEMGNGPQLGVKEMKVEVKRVLHRLSLSDKCRVLVEHHSIRIVREEKRPRPLSERKGTAPPPSQSLPYFFPR